MRLQIKKKATVQAQVARLIEILSKISFRRLRILRSFKTKMISFSKLLQEISNWKIAYGKAMNEKAAVDMKNLLELIEDVQKRLSRPCKDLDDIR